MKRKAIIAIFLILTLVLSGCKAINIPPVTQTSAPGETAENTPTPIPAPTVEPGGPDIIGIYLRSGSKEHLLTEFNDKWAQGKDIATFHAFATNDETVSGSTGKIFQSCWNNYPQADQYKVGYFLSFTLKSSEVVNLTIRGPEDAPKDPAKYFYQYVEVYMYDAIHQTGFHSHLTESAQDTLLTSFKLTAGEKIEEVESILLVAFIYKDDSFFDPDTGFYIGNVSYEIPIKNGE